MHRLFRLTLLLCLAFWAGQADAAGSRKQARLLGQTQDAYTATIRWGEFEKAWEMVDPAYREQHPMTELEFERYRQLQISGYSDLGHGSSADGTVARNVEIRVVNRHTMAERNLRYREQWRWDPEAKRWWLANGLPDLWAGQ